MFVKICGITNREDAVAAIEGGARALGFIFHPGSPRYVTPEKLADWIEDVPTDVWRVGVFVDAPAARVERTCGSLRLDVAQLHGSEPADDLPVDVRVWKAFRVDGELPSNWNDYPGAEALLLDGAASGRTFDWKLARSIQKPVVLAGGLDEGNVAEAIEQARPWGIDVCSSLELYPGKKDHARMTRFLDACRPLALNHN